MKRVRVGGQRKPWRIKEYLDGINMDMAMVAATLKITRPVVYDTVSGRRNNRKVLKELVRLGCPVNLLDLPEDLKQLDAA